MLQLDYKENLEDYEEELTNYWKEEMKLVQFIMNNDQSYYAHVPVSLEISDISGG